jgi:predicted transcriptional regulator
MNSADKVYKALCRCRGAYATIRAVADMAEIREAAARKCLVALDEAGLVDVVQVLDDKHGGRRHRCNAYMLVIDND